MGLPPGQMGNSEVGHLNLGAGRVVYQDLTRINQAIEDGTFFENPELIESFRAGCEIRQFQCIFWDCSPMEASTARSAISKP